LVCADIAGVQQGSGARGRPARKHTDAAKGSFVRHLSSRDLAQLPSYSTTKQVFKSRCQHTKHVRILSCQRVTRTSSALECRVCCGKGSKHEQLAYKVLNQLECVHAFAVEAYAVAAQVQHEGGVLNVNRHSWDVAVLQPAPLVIEVQGEQHSSKVMTKPNSTDSSLSSRCSRDDALAAAAVEAGYSVVWLVLGSERGRAARWSKTVSQALQDLEAKRAFKLYIG
jgi:hypothetical protein